MALSSELWEKKDGKFIENSENLNPNLKKYAWTWARREETEDRIQNFINQNANRITLDERI